MRTASKSIIAIVTSILFLTSCYVQRSKGKTVNETLTGVWHYTDSIKTPGLNFNRLTIYNIDNSHFIIGQTGNKSAIGNYSITKSSPYSAFKFSFYWADKKRTETAMLYLKDDRNFILTYRKRLKGKYIIISEQFSKKSEIAQL